MELIIMQANLFEVRTSITLISQYCSDSSDSSYAGTNIESLEIFGLKQLTNFSMLQRKLILKYTCKYRLRLWRPPAEPLKSAYLSDFNFS